MQIRWMILSCVMAVSAACGGGSDATAPGTSSGTPTGTTPAPTPTATTDVAMSGLQFTPASISVTPGSVVTWTNRDNTNHNVTFNSSAIASIGDFATGTKSTTMPQAPGTYTYRCTIHAGMSGTVTVQ